MSSLSALLPDRPTGTHFCYRLNTPPGPNAAGKIGYIKKNSLPHRDSIGGLAGCNTEPVNNIIEPYVWIPCKSLD
jgi:hypothetical protein